MEYTESRQKSAELLRQIIAQMNQHDAPFNPITYTVWYEYLAGLNGRLREALDRFASEEPRLSQATIERLYREHVASVDDKTMDRISRDFQQVMTNMATQVQRTGEQAGAFDAEKINDQHGHLVGDQVLAAMGEVLRKVVTHPAHVVARYGGEEFAIVLPNTSLEDTAAMAELVCRNTRAMRLRKRSAPDVVLGVTVSAGAAQHQPGESLQDWVARADAALYQSKQTGRDRVTRV